MSLVIVAAKDTNHAFDVMSAKPRKAMRNSFVVQPDGIGNFLYDFREFFLNYECYYQFDPYSQTYLGADKVRAIKHFWESIVKWLAENRTSENQLIEKYGLPMKKWNGLQSN